MSLAKLLGWFDENLVKGRARLELRGPAKAHDLAAVQAVTDVDLSAFGWSLHDGQSVPVKKRATIQGEPARLKIAWLPGAYRWLGAGEALAWTRSKYNQMTPADYQSVPERPRRLPWAASSLFFMSAICVELEGDDRGKVTFRANGNRTPKVIAPSLDAFFESYLAQLEAGRIAFDARRKRMAFEGDTVDGAFL
mgnify:CR=1 FL=1